MSRAGVYCAANACIEQVVQHGEVDVFQAVRTVRRHRPQLVNSMVGGMGVGAFRIFVLHLFLEGTSVNKSRQIRLNSKQLKLG